jgi:hypothetical protein
MNYLGQKEDTNDIATKGYVDSKIPSPSGDTAVVGPTGFCLDRSSVPWTVHFSNGCDLQLPDYQTTATIYGYGYIVSDINRKTPSSYPIPDDIMNVARGAVTIEAMKSGAAADYYSDNTVVNNPVQDASKFNFANAKFGGANAREKNKIRVLYQLGILSKNDIINLGATTA